MGHRIHGFIAALEPLREAARRLPGGRIVRLPLGFGFLPITDEFGGEDERLPFAIFERLTGRLIEWAAQTSFNCTLAYTETNYFGSVGTQSAVVWRGGEVTFGPEQSKSLWVNREYISPPLLENAINCALRMIGVERGSSLEEFDAIGLDKYRSSEKWLSAAIEE